LLDVLELQSVMGFDETTIQNLLPFVTLHSSDLVDKITFQNLSNFSENDFVLRIAQTVEKQKGFTDLPGSRYLGTAERFLLRYKFNFSNRMSAAFLVEKDAGETFFKGSKQVLSDFQSAHFAVYNIGIFRKIIIGDFSLQFGQGLTLWSGFSFGKAPDVPSIAKKDVGVKAYTSANEYSFLRGFATTFSAFRHLASSRNLDGSLSFENEEEVLSTINETGLHRTATEIKNKNSQKQSLFGAVLQYDHAGLNVGLVAHHLKFSQSFITGSQPYRSFNFTGGNLSNGGIFYSYTYKNSYIFGEAAQSVPGGLAYLNGLLLSLSGKLSAVVMYRNYARDYHNFFSQPMSESGEGSNESGCYVGFNLTPKKAWMLAVYADYFRFPWLKFRIDAPSSGVELFAQLTYTPSKTLKASFRYKSEVKQENTDTEVAINYLDRLKKENYRIDVSWQLKKLTKFQNRLEISQFTKGTGKPEFGYMLYQDFSYAPVREKITGNIRIAYFHTPSYDSRIYAYEDDVLYNFSFGMYNGIGFRTYLNVKYKIFKKMDLWARYALFFYPNQESIGSGLDEITGNKKTEVKLQMRYQF
jgi:hypothetical protein